ncbi:hypothetical protein LPW26_11290 [Rhodopseudomonas sp. HC1]|uniref:hypothetical protein n=1 Tax=Rhodopseudomonas infernalis TaxID=2897386 RepID=UPI001EE98A4B|nr:hypothetical protein [Rhodopseudomonas infernalis]MCG6205226.1 hypothetical protein [Rhodopseudomonas infernalis]
MADYVHAADASNPPMVVVEAEDPGAPGFSVISCPGRPLGQLQQVKDCVVIFAAVQGAVTITVHPRVQGGSVEAAVEIKRLGLDPLQVKDLPSPPVELPSLPRLRAQSWSTAEAREEERRAAPGVKLLCHVAGKGDVAVAAGQWIAGPESPARIEGIALVPEDDGSRPRLRYRVRYEEKKTRDGTRNLNRDFVSLGEYAGTKRRALALVGLDVELDEPHADYEITARALFLGAQVVEKSGSSVQLSGPTGREPLIGLSVAITPLWSARANGNHQGLIKSSSLADDRSIKSAQGSRVRVFRSSPNA